MFSAIQSMMLGKRNNRIVWLTVILMLVVGFVLSSCGPAAPAPEAEGEAETSAEEAATEATEEAAIEATEEAMAEATEEAMAEATEEAMAEATEEAMAEATEEAMAEATEEAMAEATEEAMAEATEEAAAESSEASGEALPIGVVLPFSGQYAWVGGNVLPVVQMLVDEVNESGGIDGSEIVLVQGDTEGTVDAGTTAAQKLATVDGVLAFVGPTSLSFTGVRTTITDNGIPMVSPTAGTTELDQAGEEYFYRTVPSDSLGGRAIARAIVSGDEYLGSEFSNVVLMVGQAPALISFKEPIESSLAEFGGGAAAAIEYKTEKQSYRTEVQEALAAEPDMIVLVGTPEDSARIMQAAFEAGYEGSWFVTQDQTNAEFIELADPTLVEGIYGLEEAPQEEAADRLEAFAEQVLAYSGEEVQIFGTNAYDAANILFLAMLRARLQDGDVTRENITENLEIVANPDEGDVEVTNFAEGKAALEAGQEINYQGLVGPANFDAYGNITAPFSIRQVQEGTWETIAVIGAEEL